MPSDALPLLCQCTALQLGMSMQEQANGCVSCTCTRTALGSAVLAADQRSICGYRTLTQGWQGMDLMLVSSTIAMLVTIFPGAYVCNLDVYEPNLI